MSDILAELDFDTSYWVNDSFLAVNFRIITQNQSAVTEKTPWWQTQTGFLLPIWQYQPSQNCGQLLLSVDQQLISDYRQCYLSIKPAINPIWHDKTIQYIVSTQSSIGCALQAARLCRQQSSKPLFLAQHAGQLPVAYQPSYIVVDGMPPGVTAAIILLEDWTIPSRLSCEHFRPGCFEGSLAELMSYCRQHRIRQSSRIISFTEYDILEGCYLNQDEVSYYPVAQYSQLKEVLQCF